MYQAYTQGTLMQDKKSMYANNPPLLMGAFHFIVTLLITAKIWSLIEAVSGHGGAGNP